MKTSLIYLLLLAAVACAAPQAGEMPGEQREEISEQMREKMAEKRKEIAEKMLERAEENGEEMAEKRKEMAEKRKEMAEKMRESSEEKREESEKLVAVAKSGEKAEARSHCRYFNEPCISAYGEYGCYYDYCYYDYDTLFYDYYTDCYCCSDDFTPYQCPQRIFYNY